MDSGKIGVVIAGSNVPVPEFVNQGDVLTWHEFLMGCADPAFILSVKPTLVCVILTSEARLIADFSVCKEEMEVMFMPEKSLSIRTWGKINEMNFMILEDVWADGAYFITGDKIPQKLFDVLSSILIQFEQAHSETGPTPHEWQHLFAERAERWLFAQTQWEWAFQQLAKQKG